MLHRVLPEFQLMHFLSQKLLLSLKCDTILHQSSFNINKGPTHTKHQHLLISICNLHGIKSFSVCGWSREKGVWRSI